MDRFCRSQNSTRTQAPTWTATTRTIRLPCYVRDIGSAKAASTLIVESVNVRSGFSRVRTEARIIQVARFGADPPRDLVELRTRVCVDVGSACGIPTITLLDAASQAGKASAKRGDNLSRHRLTVSSTSTSKSQILTQLGVTVAIDSSVRSAVVIWPRGRALSRRLTKGGTRHWRRADSGRDLAIRPTGRPGTKKLNRRMQRRAAEARARREKDPDATKRYAAAYYAARVAGGLCTGCGSTGDVVPGSQTVRGMPL